MTCSAPDCTLFFRPISQEHFHCCITASFNEHVVVGIHRAGFVLLLKKVHLVEIIFLEWLNGEETECVPIVVFFQDETARGVGAKGSLAPAPVSVSGGAGA